ncbi:hypothetical protein C9374_003942 [Naegleria lovaniensis]|uniref:Uncharacterized protein n=1 Tax=Naegleria lovaniensis TaxID=51637 RepID=A0AA88KQF8_NAELO|nr:uncharacterized protein C9374_003942 [Naegleria lovaniensis]KAG2394178.1 hypothetical protein C9374_003942 [Naegleria lovaniensis]
MDQRQQQLDDLHQLYHQYVLLDESLQGIFKRNMSEQITAATTKIKQQQHQQSAIIPAHNFNNYSNNSNHSTNNINSHEIILQTTDWNVPTEATSWYSEEDDVTSIPIPIIQTTTEDVTNNNNLNKDRFNYLIDLHYDELKVRKCCSLLEAVANQRESYSHRNHKSKSLRLCFTKEIIPSLDAWCQIKVPGCYHIGIFNFFMRNCLIKNHDKNTASTNKDMNHGYEYCEVLPNVNTRGDYQTACQPYPNHIPIKRVRLSEGCSYRFIPRDSVQVHRERDESMMNQVELRHDLDQSRFIKFKDEYDNELEAEFSRDDSSWSGCGTMILPLLAEEAMPEQLHEYMSECEEKTKAYGCYGVYLSGEANTVYSTENNSTKSFEWRGSIYFYTESYAESIGSFEMRLIR